MLLKYLLVGILFYFIVKTSRNLIRAVRGELNASPRNPRFDERSPRDGWQNGASSHPSRTTRRSERWDADIEDAKWEDL